MYPSAVTVSPRLYMSLKLLRMTIFADANGIRSSTSNMLMLIVNRTLRKPLFDSTIRNNPLFSTNNCNNHNNLLIFVIYLYIYFTFYVTRRKRESETSWL